MKKRVMGFLMTLLMILQLVLQPVPTVYASTNSCGTNASFSLNNGVLTISGTGPMYDYGYSDAPWFDMEVTELVIEEGITSIGTYAFYAAELQSITLPSTLKRIGECSFFSLGGLETLTLPEGLETIDYLAFAGCQLEEVKFPTTLKNIEDFAFSDCYQLEKAVFLSSTTTIGNDVFYYSSKNLKLHGYAGSTAERWVQQNGFAFQQMADNSCGTNAKWSLNNGVLTISGTGAMYDYGAYAMVPWADEEIREVVIGEGITTVGTAAFAGIGIEKVTLPSTLQIIGDYAFNYCWALTEVVIPSVISIGESAFYGTGIRRIEFPENLRSLGAYAFYNVPFEEIVFSEGLETIGESAFCACYGLTEITLPGTLTSIGDYAFSDCGNLGKVVIPASVTGIGTYAFNNLVIYGYPNSEAHRWAEANQGIGIVFESLADTVTGPEMPTGFAATQNSNGIELSWAVSYEDSLTGYVLKRSLDGVNFEEIAELGKDASSYLDQNVAAGVTYTYYLYPTWSEGLGECATVNQSYRDYIVPQILSLSVNPGVGGGTQNPVISISAKDNLSVDRIVLYQSPENGSSKELAVLANETLSADVSREWKWEVKDLESGNYNVEAVAYDAAGNASERQNVKVQIDNAAPPVPTGMSAEGRMDSILVMWDTDYKVPIDFNYFEVYRSTQENSGFELVSRGTDAGYYDPAAAIDSETIYYYYAVAVDRLGNVSAPTSVVSAQLLKDTESPVIADMLPRNNETICKQVSLQVSATDNYRLDRAVFSYLDNGNWVEIASVENKDKNSSKVFSYDWALPEKISGNVTIKAEVYDVSGTAAAVRTQLVNVLAYQEPAAPAVSVGNGFQRATLSWNYDVKLLPTLSQFVIYQTNAAGEKLQKVAVVNRGLKNSYTLAVAKDGVFYYVVEAVDYYGAVACSDVMEVVSAPDTTAPVAVLRVGAELAAIDQDVVFSAELSEDNDGIAAYEWDMNSDGITDATGARCIYSFGAAGTYQVTLTVRDLSGNEAVAKTTVEVCDPESEDSEYTQIWITTLNAYDEEHTPVSGAEVTVVVNDESFETVGFSDKNGLVKLTIPRKDCTVYVAAEGFASTTRAVSVDPRNRTGVTVGLMPMDVSVLGGELTVKEMTYEEIVEAGIDTTAPGNEHVFSFQTELTFVAAPGMKGMTITPVSFVNTKGELLNTVNNWLDVSFVDDTEEGGSTEDDGFEEGGIEIKTSTGKVGFFPLSEYFVLVVYGQTHWLKEMFNVELMVLNNNYLEPITDCQATLSLPNGLSLAEMVEGVQSEVIEIGRIGCNGSEEGNTAKAKWYVRGDVEGSYGLSAEVTGMVGQVPFVNTFSSEDMIQVYGGEALELTVYADNHTFRDEDYHLVYKLENVSDKSLYNVSLQLDKTELSHNFPSIELSTGRLGVNSMVIQTKDISDDGTIGFKELKPGEAIYLDMYCQPLFLSLMHLVDIGPLDIAYYLGKIVTVASDGSTTSVPCKVEYVEVTHGTLEESTGDQVGGVAKDTLVNISADQNDLGSTSSYETAIKSYKFFTQMGDRLNSVPTVTIRLQNADGEFVSMPDEASSSPSLKTRAVNEKKTLRVYTDSEDYEVTDHGEYSTMTITGDALIYVVSENSGDASLTMTTWAQSYEYDEENDKVDVVKRDINYTADFHVHDMKGTVTDPTCTEQGYTTYQCTGCLEGYVADYVDVVGHSYVNGTCSFCGDYIGPVIIQQPSDSEAALGEGYCVSVEAKGEGLKYQWYFKNAGSSVWNKSSVKDNTYDDVMTKARAGREVYCVITDANGNMITTETAKLIRVAAAELVIIKQPMDSEASLGEYYCVTVDAEGEELKYQWYFRNKGVGKWYKSSVKTNTYTNEMTKARAGREIYCVITDAWGNQVVTETAKLIRVATEELAITKQPVNGEAALGDTYSVTVEASGEELKYQWYFRNAGTSIWHKSGVRDNTYDDIMTKARNGREIYCVITDAYGNTVTTDTVKLIAVPSEELKLLNQTYESAAMGERYCLTVEAQGDGLKYQWYFRNAGSDKWYKSSVKDNTYDDVMTKARANRDVYCVITDAFGNQVTTEVMTLTVNN